MAPLTVEELALLDLERSNKGASKQRRDQINNEISTMRDLLPLPESARQRLSQLQIMSLSCVYIRKCNVLQKMLPKHHCPIEVPCDFSSALTGFLLVTTQDGKLVYISENVTEYLGHSMVDMKTQGDSLFDIVDKRDHGTLQAQLLHGVGKPDGQHERAISFFCRMNMSRTLKRQGGFGDVKVMHVKGHIVPAAQKESGSAEPNLFMALCAPLITPDVKESLIQKNTTVFKSVHKLDMSFVEISEMGEFYLGLKTRQIQNQSWYSMIHPEDLTEARAKHVQLIKSRNETGCMLTVRMLTNDNIIWLNIVMHVKEALVSNREDPVIACINQVISEEEAKQFRMQGQLFALNSSQSPNLFLGANYLHHLPLDPEIIGRQQAEVYVQQQQAFFADQQRYQYAPSGTEPTCYPCPRNQYSLPSMELVCQQPQGHTTTIKALKRKLQENVISNCKPSKVPRVISGDMKDDVSTVESQHLGDSHYVMDLDVFRSVSGVNQTMNRNDAGALQAVYQTPAINSLQAIIQKMSTTMMNPNAPVCTPVVVQKLNPTCSLEQVVPDMSIPDCNLTPDASPVSSPKPTAAVPMKHDAHEISQMTTYVRDRLHEFKQSRAIYEDSAAVKSNDKNVMQKLLPVIDAIFVDSFFDEFKPMPKEECMDFKFEPLSPTPTVQLTQNQQTEEDVRVLLPSAITTIGRSQPYQPSIVPMCSNAVCAVKDDLSLEDCTDLEKLLGFVDTACIDQNMLSPDSITDVLSPALSPESASNSFFSEYSPVSPPFGSQTCVKHSLNLEVNPGSNSPMYDGLEDLLDPDNWLQEPISISLDMSLPDFDISPCGVKATCQDPDLYQLKQLLQHSWESRGIPSHNFL